MKVGMEKYRRQYPHTDILLFEPDCEDADMFFANIFSYSHRRRLCEAAYHKTRQRLFAQRGSLEPLLARHGIRLSVERLREPQHSIRAALTDPRPLSMHAPTVRTAARDLAYTLDQLERWLHHTRRLPRRMRAATAR